MHAMNPNTLLYSVLGQSESCALPSISLGLPRVQSFRRSIRDSFRRRRTTSMSAVDDRKIIADTLNLESESAQKKGRGIRRTNTQPSSSTSPLHQGRGEQVAPELAGYVTCLTFADTHSSGVFVSCLYLSVCLSEEGVYF